MSKERGDTSPPQEITENSHAETPIYDTDEYTSDGVRQYLNEIHHPLLTHEQEFELAKRYERKKELQAHIEEIEDEDIRELAINDPEYQTILQDGEEAKKELTTNNLRLVVPIAKKYRGRGVDFNDLIQEGNIGLMRAVEKYEPDRGNRFSTYATNWIRQKMERCIRNTGDTIRVPIYLHDFHTKIKIANRELLQENGIEPTTKEVAERLSVPEKKVTETIDSFTTTSTTSLDNKLGDEDSNLLGDLIKDHSANFTNEVEGSLVVEQILTLAEKVLSEKEFTVIYHRYLPHPHDRPTLQEIAKTQGVSKEYIRQVQEKAKKKLRPVLAENGLRIEDI